MTAQMHEILLIDGDELSMAFCPPIPEDAKLIEELSDEEGYKSIEGHKWRNHIFSTACWRGYLGTWEIKNERLYLNNVIGRYRMKHHEPIFASWFTGVLRIPKGEVIEGVHMGFGTVFEGELHIKVENGLVKKTKEIQNTDKTINECKLAQDNLPGNENRFSGDDL